MEKVALKPISLTPSQKASLEIMRLDREPDLQQESMIGGPTPPEMEERNKRRREEYQKRKLAIIEKYEVAAEFLEPLLQKQKLLLSKLSPIQQEIVQLRALVK